MNYLGYKATRHQYSMRFFLRTGKQGENWADTSKYFGHRNDFAYKFDKTCYYKDSKPRKFLNSDLILMKMQ